MGYCAASDVQSLSKNLTGAEDMFSTSTCPGISAVDSWISSGCGWIETAIQAHGYSVPVASTTSVYGHLKHCNSLFAAGMAEMSRTNVILAPGERSRGQVFYTMFKECMKDLFSQGDLTLVGLSKSSNRGKIYVGGISVSDKQDRYDDTDMAGARFRRGQFRFPDTLQPFTNNDDE